MAELGFRTVDEMVGRADCLDIEEAVTHWKAHGLDLRPLLYMPDLPASVARHRVRAQDHGLDVALDNDLIAKSRPALELRMPVEINAFIRNADRTVGTMLGSEVTRKYGAAGLPDDTIRIAFTGSAGQSFGAFIPRGMTMTLVGDANDGFGKGLSGGKLAVFPPRTATFEPENNVVIGNVALYGATSGEAYVRGRAGERFAVRNSGAHAVVEGIGDHGCEYMTGGRVVVIGPTGRNFAAGMSGGTAYVYDANGDFPKRCNLGMVELEPLLEEDLDLITTMIGRHVEQTRSEYAAALLAEWPAHEKRFVKVMPRDYRRVLEAGRQAHAQGREPTFGELVGATSG
jgi:glutamate synthase (ferredoxin)